MRKSKNALIKENRLNNLRYLVNQNNGTKEFSEKTGTNRSYISQILNKNKTQRGKTVSLGNEVSEKIENALDLPVGWMDESHGYEFKFGKTICSTGLFDHAIEWLSLLSKLNEEQRNMLFKLAKEISDNNKEKKP